MAEPTLYLFDGYNLLHAGDFRHAGELTDALASFVGSKGARGIVVFDGLGEQRTLGALEVRFAQHADSLLERLAAEHRDRERVVLVSSDAAVRGTSGAQVRTVSSRAFVTGLSAIRHVEGETSRLRDRVDEATRERLERMRRGQ
jgi:predicted RNA-binding protein with PIN domain